jgi:acetyl esterase/lipase
VTDNASAALAWAKAKIGQFGDDPARIAIGSDSAGGIPTSSALTATRR